MEALFGVGIILLIVFYICKLVLQAVGRVLEPVARSACVVLDVVNESLVAVNNELSAINDELELLTSELEVELEQKKRSLDRDV